MERGEYNIIIVQQIPSQFLRSLSCILSQFHQHNVIWTKRVEIIHLGWIAHKTDEALGILYITP